MQNIYIAIDGGGTKTACLLSDKKNIYKNFIAGPSNFQDQKNFTKSIEELFFQINKYFKEINLKKIKIQIKAGFAGIIGIENSKQEASSLLRKAFEKSNNNEEIIIDNIQVISDATLVLQSYFPNQEGIIVISGTGSISLSQDKNGNIYRCGGFGHLIDDFGSGYYFGKKAIKIALYSKFHFDKKSILESEILKLYQINTLEQLTSKIYKENKGFTAKAAPLLFLAAEQGCIYAQDAINKGIQELENYLLNHIQRLKNNSLRIILHGSVFKNQPILQKKLQEKLKNHQILVGNQDILETTIKYM